MFCQKCGQEILDQAKFCSHCGAEIIRVHFEEPNADPVDQVQVDSNACTEKVSEIKKEILVKMEKKSETKNRKKILLILLAILLIAVIGVVAYIKITDRMYEEAIDEGNTGLVTRDYETTEEAYTTAIKLKKNKVEGYDHLADFYFHLGRYADAISVLEDALGAINTRDDRIHIYAQYIQALRASGITEEDLLEIFEAAFIDTGDRTFSEDREALLAKYLENLARVGDHECMMPVFSGGENIDGNWLLSRIVTTNSNEASDLVDDARLNKCFPYGTISNATSIAQQYINADITLPQDADYDLIADTGKLYDPSTGVIYAPARGYSSYFYLDFYVVDYQKKGDTYIVDGILLGLSPQGRKGEYAYEGVSVGDVFDVYAGSYFNNDGGDSDEMICVGTATVSACEQGGLTGFSNNDYTYTFDYDFDSLDGIVYRYELQDNPQGDQSNLSQYNNSDLFGPYTILSRKALSESSETISLKQEETETEEEHTWEEGYQEIYGPIIKKYADDYTYLIGSDYSDSWSDYALFDITGNGSPELIISGGTCEADNFYDVYTIEDGAAKKIGNFQSRASSFYGESGTENGNLYFSWAHMGYTWAGKIVYDGSQITTEELFHEESDIFFWTPYYVPTYASEQCDW